MSNIRKCHYIKCLHETQDIDISKEEFQKDGRLYYHKDCYELKKKSDWKDQKTKEDIRSIIDLWNEHISNTVNFGYLTKILNEYIARGVSSEYLLFVLRYVIDHKMKLNYPPGFRYYVDKQIIKEAYNKQKTREMLKKQSFDNIQKQDDSPKFSIKQKNNGFQSILRHN